MVATSRHSCASMAAVIMMLSVATVGEAPSYFLYPGRVRSLLPSATARALTLPSRFSTMFMSEWRACFRSSGESKWELTGWYVSWGCICLSLVMAAVSPVSPNFLRPALRLYDCANATAQVSGME